MPIRYEEVVKTVVFDVIDTDDDGLVYRLEVLKSSNGFRGELFRLDTFSLQCSFVDSKPDESFYVLDTHSHSIDLDEKIFDDAQSCIDFVANALQENFS
ncbi:hypothetical protein B0181_01100 [Moraxella caviae]|uniref:Uncharacterized protein n=1 Tax=Moraxella caviae TaxID=34060 RepID=A0A1T0AB47_9GAMM|nr:hypothetical protein [Moraxella caviae]OOR92910.1 hypothetical protein B0181_01100 [Moraxella caviae]STZ14964.1 Uncharacterised protein [Moraxella caviae]VEW13101.1 Uncharacterised protein [Moraxella caviae]